MELCLPKKTFQARWSKRCILTRRTRPNEGFIGYGAAKAVGPVTLKSLPYLSFTNEVLSKGKADVFHEGGLEFEPNFA